VAEPPPTTTTARTTETTERTTEPTTEPAEPTASASAVAGTPVADTSSGLGPLGWLILVLLAAGVLGGVLIWRSRRRGRWAADAGTLVVDTRTVVDVRLPSVLATVTAAQRALSWPPVRADLADLVRRWGLLSQNAPGDERADWSRQVWSILEELVTAVDAENEALAADREWRPLRQRIDDAGRALATTLRAGQGPEPSMV